MLYVAISWARAAGVREVCANYCQTTKNKPCCDFFKKSGLSCRDGNMFVWDAAKIYSLHSAIRLISNDGGTFEKTSADMDPPELITGTDHVHDAEINADLTPN